MTRATMIQLLDRVRGFLEQEYNLDVQLIREEVVLTQQVAEWRNGRLLIDVRGRGLMGSLCILCHVFGHLVQHSTMKERYESMWSIVNSQKPPLRVDQEFKSQYFLYEKEAYQIGKGVLEEVTDMDAELEGIYQAFMMTDLEHYWNYLITGEVSSRNAFNRSFRELRKRFKTTIPQELPSISPPNVLGDLQATEILVI